MSLKKQLSKDEFELFAWGSSADIDLPTFDPFCLSIASYLTMSGADWTIHVSRNPKKSPTGEFPVLRVGVEPVAGVSNIIQTLKSKGYDLDAHLTSRQRIESRAYISLIEDSLFEVLLYNWWLEEKNMSKSTGKRYNDATTFLSRYHVLSNLKSRATTRVGNYQKMKECDERISELYQRARDAYRALSTKLGDQPYFFGSTPSTLDAVALSHLAIHLIPSLAVPKLFSMLMFEFPSLVKYVERLKSEILKEPVRLSPTARLPFRVQFANFVNDPIPYVQWVMNGFETKLVPSTSSKTTTVETERDREERVEKFWKGFSVVSAIVCFGAFITSHGLLTHITLGQGDDEDDDY